MLRTLRKERGSSLVVVLTVVMVCSGIAASVMLPALSRSRKAQADLAEERAFQVAEAGIDWAIAETRKRGGALPSTPTETGTPSSLGTFTITYTSAQANGIDDDGDSAVDEADEANFIALRSVGSSGGADRAIQVLLRRAVQMPSLEGAVQINVETPIVDFRGNAFRISGNEHDLGGNPDLAATPSAGIASPAVPGDIIAQIPANRHGNITGSGGSPSVEQVPAMDLALLVQQAASAATVVLGPGNHSGTFGTPGAGTTEIVYAPQDITFTGGGGGAGVLVVDGDLEINGGFEWVGIVLVRGNVNMRGGGGGKRIIGGLVVGEDINGSNSVEVNGTVDV